MQFIHSDGFTRVDGAHVVGFVFLCKWKSGEAQPLEDTEEVRWFTLEELKNFTEVEKWMKVEIGKLYKLEYNHI